VSAWVLEQLVMQLRLYELVQVHVAKLRVEVRLAPFVIIKVVSVLRLFR
jgi:hypothetical protein